MICKKCGRVLQENETFCSVCGEPVISLTDEAAAEAEESKPIRISPLTSEFEWDVEAFPGRENHKTEDVDFDWGSGEEFPKIGEERPEPPSAEDMEEDIKEMRFSTEPEADQQEAASEKAGGEPAVTIEGENAVFDETPVAGESNAMTDEGIAQAQIIDKYYTFNQKNEEFQELLDREYEKIKSGNIIGDEQRSADKAAEEKFVPGQPVINDDLDELFAEQGLATEVPQKPYEPELKPDPDFEMKMELMDQEEENTQKISAEEVRKEIEEAEARALEEDVEEKTSFAEIPGIAAIGNVASGLVRKFKGGEEKEASDNTDEMDKEELEDAADETDAFDEAPGETEDIEKEVTDEATEEATEEDASADDIDIPEEDDIPVTLEDLVDNSEETAGDGDVKGAASAIPSAGLAAAYRMNATSDSTIEEISEKAEKDAESEAARAAEQIEAEEQARREAEEQARREAEEQARREAEEQARREAEEQARREAEEKAKFEAEEEARRLAEEQAKRDAEEKARLEAEERAKIEAEEWARRQAEEQKAKEDAERARIAAEEKEREEAAAALRREAEERARREEEAKAEAEALAAAEEKARKEAAERAKIEAEEWARRQAEEQKAKEDAEKARLAAEEEERLAEEKAKAEAEEKARIEAEEQAKREAEEQARLGAEEKARAEAEQQARKEAEEAAALAAASAGAVSAEEHVPENHIEEMAMAREKFFTSADADLGVEDYLKPDRNENGELLIDPMTDEELELMKRDSEFDWNAATKMIDKEALMAELEAIRLADETDKDELGINDADQAFLGETESPAAEREKADHPFRSDGEDTGESGTNEGAEPGPEFADESSEPETGEKEDEDKDIEDKEDGVKAIIGDSGHHSDSAGAEVETPKKKRGKGRVVLNIILAILIILLVCEVAIVGIKFLMPNSAAAEWIDNITVKVIQWASTKFNFL